jgi:hypothetical protein
MKLFLNWLVNVVNLYYFIQIIYITLFYILNLNNIYLNMESNEISNHPKRN